MMEFTQSWKLKEWSILAVKKNNIIKFYEEKNPIKELFLTNKSGFHRYYINDIIPIISDILSLKDECGLKIKIKIIKNKIYYAKIETKDKTKSLTILNLTLMIGMEISNLNSEMNLNYTSLPYWDKFDIEEDQGMHAFLKKKFQKGYLENLDLDELEEKKVINLSEINMNEVRAALENNLISLEKIFYEIKKKLSTITPEWPYSLSIGSVSKNIFLNLFNKYDIKIQNNVTLDSLIRLSYYGGRCEIFGNPYYNEERIFHMDYKNMYGEILKDDFPTGGLEKIASMKNLKIKGFYLVKVESNLKLPILPYREGQKKLNDKQKLENERALNTSEGLIFPNGRFSGWYYSEELEYFLKQGGIIKEIIKGVVFKEEEEKKIFKEFSEFMINKREEDGFFIWKRILVAFYGRLGMRPVESEIKIISKKDYIKAKKKFENKKLINETWINDHCFLEIEKKETAVESLVQYAAIVASRARIKLHKAMQEVEKEGGRLLYCDTDSIFATYEKNFEKKNSKIKWDEREIEDAVFADIRMYSILWQSNPNFYTWETRIAGVTRNAIDFTSLKKKFYIKNSKPWFEDGGEATIQSIKKIPIEKSISTEDYIWMREYKKRTFNKSHKKTKPLEIDDN